MSAKMGKGKRKALARLTGPVLYCTGCGGRIGTYTPPEGRLGVPKPAASLCPDCMERVLKASQPHPPKKHPKPLRLVKTDKDDPRARYRSSSVRTVSGGLPTLGRGHK